MSPFRVEFRAAECEDRTNNDQCSRLASGDATMR